MSDARLQNGTRCSRLSFMCSAGTVQSFSFALISFRAAVVAERREPFDDEIALFYPQSYPMRRGRGAAQEPRAPKSGSFSLDAR